MKKEYKKPELDTKAYAQFESVFTKCDREHDCKVVEDWSPSGSSYTSHQSLEGHT